MDLKTWRERKGMTQAELAERLGTFQSRISAWETGRVNPDLESAVLIMDVTGGEVSLRDLAKKGPGGR
jgi:transcriptional regulator with XRE-family HTH domain